MPELVERAARQRLLGLQPVSYQHTPRWTLVANAITAWMTEYLGLAAEQLRAKAGGSTTRSWRTCPRLSRSPSG